MSLWNDYIDYLKDNPEGYWFKSKLYGYGWTPAKPAGWLVIGIYLTFLLGIVFYDKFLDVEPIDPIKLLYIIAGSTVLLVLISWKKGEPLKWQWGIDDKK